MFTLEGKYGQAVVYADLVDNESISQIVGMLNQPFTKGARVRIMPDVHAGKGCTIGTTISVNGMVCPNIVGVDIGCGMFAARLRERDLDFAKLDKIIREDIPCGFSVREKEHRNVKKLSLDNLCCADKCDLSRAKKSLGTLGGGNHFIECARSKEGDIWLVIHSGSRHLGVEVASYYQKAAIKDIGSIPSERVKEVVKSLKAAGRQKDIQKELGKIKPRYGYIPDGLCWCEGYLLEHYINDMKITQQFAMLNRQTMAEIIAEKMGFCFEESFTTIHNYLDTNRMIIRKGAVSAEKNEKLIIPMNMRDGSLICVGKGNPEWNYSAPHGAGRLMSRSKAKQVLSMDDFRDSMNGIWTTSVNLSTIDESPMAYKSSEDIIRHIGDTVDVVDIIKPLYNFKAGE